MIWLDAAFGVIVLLLLVKLSGQLEEVRFLLSRRLPPDPDDDDD